MRRLPFILHPAAKDYLWGGNRLNEEFNKGIEMSPLAETWECSTHPDGQCFAGSVKLGEVLKNHPKWLGSHSLQITSGMSVLPILIKLVDAKEDLSVQVHPDDEYARKHENGALGKTEMWYVIAAEKGAEIIYGFRDDMTVDSVKQSIETGRIGCHLNHIPVEKGDLFFIEPGIVHAIGAGCLIAEIQESSNITYRLFDYNRMDKNGEKRPLHIKKALDVANLKSSIIPRQPMRVLKYKQGFASELLCRCKYFQVERALLNTEVQRYLVDYQTNGNSFHALLCVDGCGSITAEEFSLHFFKGDCIFVPAGSDKLKFHGMAQILDVSC